MVTVRTERGRAFADIVYTILEIERRFSIKEIAPLMGMEYAALHSRVINRTPFSADEITKLIVAVPDLRLVDYFLDDSAFVAVDRTLGGRDTVKDVHLGATRSVIEAAEVLRSVELAMADSKIDHRDRVLIEGEIDEAERALAALRHRLSQNDHQ